MKTILTLTMVAVISTFMFSQTAQLKKVVNKVSHFTKTKNTTLQAKTGELLFTGDEITTEEKSLATVQFIDDNSLLIVRENSNLEIYGSANGRKLAKKTVLNKGQLNFNVTHRKDQDFIFTTPTAVASIRGTEGSLQSLIDGSTVLYVDTGAVEIQSSIGPKQSGIVRTGQKAKVLADGELFIDQADEQTKKVYKRNNLVNTQKVTIKTDKGDIIIEYLPDEQ